jgi:hypothetical protein
MIRISRAKIVFFNGLRDWMPEVFGEAQNLTGKLQKHI